ncbi:MAG: hypothetical protein KDD66_10290 [Bdellovibrionales bacterium]|nr:hypothetical protein [Bdellovibrionales bacterium]
MSSSLGSIVSQTGSIAATAQGASARGAEASAVSNSGTNAAAASTTGGAAVVSLSASSKERAASRGESRQVDAAFDKQASKSANRENGKGKAVNVSA